MTARRGPWPSGPLLRRSGGCGGAICLALMALAACGNGDGHVTVRDRDGREVDTGTVELYRGDDHCGWQGVTFLVLGSQVTHDTRRDVQMYIRDPDGVLTDQTVASYEPSVTLPQEARFTGYSSDAGRLWLSSDDEVPVVYVVSTDGRKHVEAWPRTKGIVGCD